MRRVGTEAEPPQDDPRLDGKVSFGKERTLRSHALLESRAGPQVPVLGEEPQLDLKAVAPRDVVGIDPSHVAPAGNGQPLVSGDIWSTLLTALQQPHSGILPNGAFDHVDGRVF